MTIEEIIIDAVNEMNEFYSNIKKSKRILDYKNEGQQILDIFINILASFSLSQIAEISLTSKMVSNDTNEILDKNLRFKFIVNRYKDFIDYYASQYIRELDEK